MSTQTVTGSFPRNDASVFAPPGFTLIDEAAVRPGYTPGVVRVVNPTIQPTLVQHWRVIAWSLRLRIGAIWLPSAGDTWARFGDLWAGLIVDASASNAGGLNGAGVPLPGNASFPFDLSTFAKVWSGDDPIRNLGLGVLGSQPETAYQLVGTTFGLPTPIEARPGTQFQFALIMTPSLFGAQVFNLLISSCDFTIIYDDGT